jgi:hypothetical protein
MLLDAAGGLVFHLRAGEPRHGQLGDIPSSAIRIDR